MLKVKGQEKKHHAKNTNEKNYVAILIPDKVDFKKNIPWKEGRHFIMDKGSIHQEHITSINVNAPNTKTERTKR